ncbi:glycoside hydrolase family 30 protein [Sphaerobolus stellatus SS14]|nr:glycoside hydrolase family 30 protein [Sphaerobolus stellatus SS14]
MPSLSSWQIWESAKMDNQSRTHRSLTALLSLLAVAYNVSVPLALLTTMEGLDGEELRLANALIYRLELLDGRRLIARIRAPWLKQYGAGVAPKDTMESEVATIKYIKKHTDIPVPHVYIHDKDYEGSVGGEWMLYDEIPGMNLASVWPSLDREQKQRVSLAIVGIWAELAKTRFSEIGSIRSKEETGEFYVGPIAFMPSRSDGDQGPPLPKRCGPFPTARKWLLAMAQQDLAFQRKQPLDVQEKAWISRTMAFVNSAPLFYLDKKWSSSTATTDTQALCTANVLRHLDLQLHNIIVDNVDPTSIRGVIDWEGVCIVPLWSLRPEFLMTVDAQRSTSGEEIRQLREICLKEFARRVPEWVAIHDSTKEARMLSIRAAYSQSNPEEEFMKTLINTVTSATWTVIATNVSTTASQTINGIGASGAWWPIDLYSYPDSVKSQVADMLFGSDGLKLTSYRYNLGGGGVFVGNPSRAPQTPFVSQGVYNFSADPQGTYFLKKAAQANVPIITLFVNSAPPAFTSNNRSCGGTIVNATVQGYTQYIADVVNYWLTQGVRITHISPMNEPDSGFDNGPSTPCGQEGMIVTPSQRALVVNTLRNTLNAAGLRNVGIMGDESSSTGNFIPEAPTWIPSAKGSLAAISHHQYGFGTDSQVAQLGSTGRNLSGGVSTWFTEICCFAASDGSQNPAAQLTYSQGFDPTMVGGLQMGSLIYQSFTQALDAHFDWWTALSSGIGCDPRSSSSCVTTANGNGWNDGLLYYDPSASSDQNFAIYTTKRFFVMKHFSQFIPIGAVRHAVTGVATSVRALAFKTASGWSLIAMNMGSGSTPFALPTGLGTVHQVMQTSPSADWANLQIVQAPSNVTLPALSITTFLF